METLTPALAGKSFLQTTQSPHHLTTVVHFTRPSKARDFEGVGGPEDKAQAYAEAQGGNDDVRSNIRQGGDTIRPAGSMSNNAADGTGKRTN